MVVGVGWRVRVEAGRWWQVAFPDEQDMKLVRNLELVEVAVDGVRVAVDTRSQVVFPDRMVREVVVVAGGRVKDVVGADT